MLPTHLGSDRASSVEQLSITVRVIRVTILVAGSEGVPGVPCVHTIVELETKAIQRCVITEKAPTRALTPRSLNVKLGPRRNYHEGRAAIRHYADQPALPL